MEKKYLTLKRIGHFIMIAAIGTILSICYVDMNPSLFNGPPLYGPEGSTVDINRNMILAGALVLAYICVAFYIGLHYWNWKQDQKDAEKRKLELENFY